MRIVKQNRAAFLAVLGLVVAAQGLSAQACDEVLTASRPAQPAAQVSTPPCVKQLVDQLEKLVEPMSDRVSACNDKLELAQASVQSINGKLVAEQAEQDKSLRALKLLKRSLEQPGCTVKIEEQCYARETVGGAIEIKLSAFRQQSKKIGALSSELQIAQQQLQIVEEQVARWVAKEKELLSQIQSLESTAQRTADDNARARQQATALADTITKMLGNSSTPKAINTQPVSKSESEVLAEVDRALSMQR